jgi:hypothetical protein
MTEALAAMFEGLQIRTIQPGSMMWCRPDA